MSERWKERWNRMTPELLAAQIKGLEAQIRMLKAQIKSLSAPVPPRTLGDLYGLLAGKSDSSEEEIDEVLYQFDWEDEAPPGAPG
jgi:hypothetical protein